MIFLLSSRQKYNESENQNNSAFQLTAKNGHLETAQFLHAKYKYVDLNFAMLSACENGHLDVVRFLHSQGADIQTVRSHPIKWAANAEHFEMARYFYQQGVDIFMIQRPHDIIAAYITAKKIVEMDISRLKRQAAKTFVAHYETLPKANTIPEDVMKILIAAKY